MMHPCTPHCPMRSGRCHSSCPEWQTYEAQKMEEYRRKDAEYAYRDEYFDYKLLTDRRFRRRIAEV